jgi:H+/Cl- antiporter ClcA
MMAIKIICFVGVGAALGLLVFSALSLLVVMLAGSVLRPLSLNFHHLFPLYLGIFVAVMGLPVGAYYGMIFAFRSRGYSFGDYCRSIRDFMSNT